MRKGIAFAKFILLIIQILLTINICYCQNIKGWIIDSATRKSIPYVIIRSKNDVKASTISDCNGLFRIELKNSEDTLLFEALGYYSKKIIANNLSIDSVIILKQKTYDIGGLEIKAKKRKIHNIRIGFQKNFLPGKYMLGPGCQVAVFFPNNEHYVGIVSKIGYFIKGDGFPTANFRVRIYNNCLAYDAPNQDLLDTNLIVHGIEGEEWLYIDIKRFEIKIPKNGYYVAMEWLPSSSGLGYNPSNLPSYTGYGQILGGTDESKKYPENTWSKKFPYGWTKSSNLSRLNTMNAAINSEIIIFHRYNKNNYFSKLSDSSDFFVYNDDFINKNLKAVELDTNTYPQSSITILFNSLLKCLHNNSLNYLFAYLVYFDDDTFSKSITEIIKRNKKRKNLLNKKQKNTLYDDIYNIQKALNNAKFKQYDKICTMETENKYIVNLMRIENSWRIDLNFFKKD